jgi:uncharacterized protein (DUF2267 family)
LAEYALSGNAGAGERFSVDEFFQRVSDREGVDLPQAVFHTRAVIEVLQKALTKGEVNNIRAQFPAEYKRLFEAGSLGGM